MTYETEMYDAIEEISRLEKVADEMWFSHIHSKEDLIKLTQLVAKAQIMLIESRAMFDEAQRVAAEAQTHFDEIYKTQVKK
jgi:hypothetical protein